jgi:multisubunit Na+/H+ antiporter MnhB subunit
MRRELSVAIVLILGAFLMLIPLGITFGDPEHSAMDDYFIRNGQGQTAANNIVTAILFDYRGFDTLGESTILFTAVVGVGLMFRKLMRGDADENE